MSFENIADDGTALFRQIDVSLNIAQRINYDGFPLAFYIISRLRQAFGIKLLYVHEKELKDAKITLKNGRVIPTVSTKIFCSLCHQIFYHFIYFVNSIVINGVINKFTVTLCVYDARSAQDSQMLAGHRLFQT